MAVEWIKPCVKSSLMAHISRSIQQGTILWGSHSDIWLCLAIQTQLCQHLLSLWAYIAYMWSVICGVLYSYSMQTVWANSSLISARQSSRIHVLSSSRRGGGTYGKHSGASSSSLRTSMSSSNGPQVSQTLTLKPEEKNTHTHTQLSPYAQAKSKHNLFFDARQTWDLKTPWHLDVWMFI